MALATKLAVAAAAVERLQDVLEDTLADVGDAEDTICDAVWADLVLSRGAIDAPVRMTAREYVHTLQEQLARWTAEQRRLARALLEGRG